VKNVTYYLSEFFVFFDFNMISLLKSLKNCPAIGTIIHFKKKRKEKENNALTQKRCLTLHVANNYRFKFKNIFIEKLSAYIIPTINLIVVCICLSIIIISAIIYFIYHFRHVQFTMYFFWFFCIV
jgi:hypothetical protein